MSTIRADTWEAMRISHRASLRSRPTTVIATVIAAMIAVVVVASCGDDSTTGSSTSAAAETTAADTAPSTDACTILTLADANALADVAMELEPEESAELLTSSCKYVSVGPADPGAGQVLRQLRLDVYSGSQFFDQEGNYYPRHERDGVEIGDEGFVHVGDEQRGVTVQVAIGDMVYSVNYTELAILTDERPNAAAKRDDLVALVEQKLRPGADG
jgi:hypothetical protein